MVTENKRPEKRRKRMAKAKERVEMVKPLKRVMEKKSG